MFRTALRLLRYKMKVARSLYSCSRMFRTALRLLGKATKYLYSCFSTSILTPRLLR